MDEIQWYGWFIDYWMEGGLKRDIFTHELTDEAWPYFPEPAPVPDCINDPWHAHKTQPNICTNNGEYDTPNPTRNPTQYPTKTPTPMPTPTAAPTPNVTLANYTAPEIYDPPPGPTPPLPPPDVAQPIPYLFTSSAACCQAKFPGEECRIQNVCPTPSPTPEIPMTYDAKCSKVTNGCEPVAVISAEKLRDLNEGPAETVAIGRVLQGTSAGHTALNLIGEEAWQCIWEELIPKGKGNRMVKDRGGYVEADYNFSEEMLQAMIDELNRLVIKYTSSYWSGKATANRLSQLLSEHLAAIQVELTEVQNGSRKLTDRDFLGPNERQRRRRIQAQLAGRDPFDDEMDLEEKKKAFEYFTGLEEKVKTTRRMEQAAKRKAVEQSAIY